jgi:hypothetical protein
MAIVELKTAQEMVSKTIQSQPQAQAKPKTEANVGLEQDSSKFQKLLEQQHQDSLKLLDQMGINLSGEAQPQIKAMSAEGLNVDSSKIGVKNEIETSNKVESVFSELNRGQLQMDNIMELVSSGRRFNNTELLTIQAGMHSIVLEMDLTAKAVEKTNEAHNTIWRTQLA